MPVEDTCAGEKSSVHEKSGFETLCVFSFHACSFLSFPPIAIMLSFLNKDNNAHSVHDATCQKQGVSASEDRLPDGYAG
jgi:hypothetical protein